MKALRTKGVAAQTAQDAQPGPELPSDKAFVLQLTRDTDPRLQTFSGRVEHLSSGRRLRFEALADFLAALRRLLEETTQQ